ncbi:unnamed protein product [Polarella glacialis]|uniref:Uncharacterized protein n=1 Tax=Polarella glacialis TaxID=89957 RepID=A0A813D0X8_POLGL|nr:unnamed protein product [Polarella glacialis]
MASLESINTQFHDVMWELAGVTQVLKWQLSFCQQVGFVMDKSNEDLKIAKDFVENFKGKIEPAIADMKRIIEKMEKPFVDVAAGAKNDLVAAESAAEGFLHRIHVM